MTMGGPSQLPNLQKTNPLGKDLGVFGELITGASVGARDAGFSRRVVLRWKTCRGFRVRVAGHPGSQSFGGKVRRCWTY